MNESTPTCRQKHSSSQIPEHQHGRAHKRWSRSLWLRTSSNYRRCATPPLCPCPAPPTAHNVCRWRRLRVVASSDQYNAYTRAVTWRRDCPSTRKHVRRNCRTRRRGHGRQALRHILFQSRHDRMQRRKGRSWAALNPHTASL